MPKCFCPILLCFFLLLAVCGPLSGRSESLLRDDPQAGLPKPTSGLKNPEAADKEDEECLANATDGKALSACDDAEIERQKLRMERAWNTLIHTERSDMANVDVGSLFNSQDQWKKYEESTCNFVASLYYPADFGRHANTCEWRMTRQRADELEILLKNYISFDSPTQQPSGPPIPFPQDFGPPKTRDITK